MEGFEKLGVFYLGKEYDLARKQRLDNLLPVSYTHLTLPTIYSV